MLFQHKHSLNKQSGVVIVIALFVMALVATMSYVMMARLARDTERVQLILRDVQAESVAQGSIAWAINLLQQNEVKKKENQLVDLLPITSPVDHVQGFAIKSTIEDAQARLNINNLTDPAWQADFSRLIKAVYPAFPTEQLKPLLLAISHWLTPGNNNPLDEYYAKLAMPYRAAHRKFTATSELKLIKGMTPTLYELLQPYLIALPESTQINAATAAAPLFVAVSPTLPLEAAKAVVAKRAPAAKFNLDRFLEMDLLKNHPPTPNHLMMVSQYFLVVTEISIENQRLVLYTLLQRLIENDHPRVIILWQSKGIW